MKSVLRFIKKDPVLSIAALCAVVTAFFVPPDKGYIAYMDLRVLCLLLCLMAVVAGFGSCGAFSTLAYALLRRCRRGQVLGFVLVMLPFFTSMLVTNDVALLTFVPFTMLLLGQMGCHKSLIPTLVLQTVAANLGSMATPVGNPQNLYLYGYYALSPGEFFSAMLPLTTACFMGLGVASLFLLPKVLPTVEMEKESLHDTKKLLIYAALFVLCLTAVFRWIHYAVVTVIVVLVLFLLNRSLLKKVDYLLLVTFVCFFILSGNLGRMDGVREFLQSLLERSTLLVPRDLDSVSYCSFDSRRGCLVFLCNRRIEHLCHGVYYIAVTHGHKNCCAKILVSLYMRGHAYLMYYLRNVALNVGGKRIVRA